MSYDLIERLNTVREGMEAGITDWPISSHIWEYKEAVKLIEQLQARVAELEKEVERLQRSARIEKIASDTCSHKEEADELRQQIAIAEEHNARLVEAGTKLIHSIQRKDLLLAIHPLNEALSLPASREALDKYVAEKVTAIVALVRSWGATHSFGMTAIGERLLDNVADAIKCGAWKEFKK